MALTDYVEAFGEKVDRIANYLKVLEAFAELAKREEERLHARRNAAESHVKGLKAFLCFWMSSRGVKLPRGRLNTITLAKNSVDTLVIAYNAQVPDRYHKVTIQMTWDEWAVLMSLPPNSPLRERLAKEGVVGKELNRSHLQEAVAGRVVVPGVGLIRGHHLRLG